VVRRRRECQACSRRFSTEEIDTAAWLGELPVTEHGDGSGPLEAVRRRAILAAAKDENDRRHHEVLDRGRMREMVEEKQGARS
jgi:hypothetical protein